VEIRLSLKHVWNILGKCVFCTNKLCRFKLVSWSTLC